MRNHHDQVISINTSLRVGLLALLPHAALAGEPELNLHIENVDVVQGDFNFPAKYSGPNSLNPNGEIAETVTMQVFGGGRLWRGAEVHVGALMWQGYGLSKTFGIEAFPNGDAFKAGTWIPNFTVSRLFLRQTIGFGGKKEDVPDGQLTLAGRRDVSRLTITIGRFTPMDVFDDNAYARDPHTQFLNWAMMGNLAWDYGQDTVGFTTGVAVELNLPAWAVRYGFFQMPRDKNGFTSEDQVLMWPQRGVDGPFAQSWAMAGEVEYRYRIGTHPGAIRFLAWLNEADMASYQAATAILQTQGPGADLSPARAYRYKYGFGLNIEQELARNVGVFSRLGWNDGHNEAWTYTDVNYTISLGVSAGGALWRRPGDTAGLAAVVSGASPDNQQFLAAGGTDLLDGDGMLNYGWETVLEAFYDFRICDHFHAAFDYQFIANPAFNRDRGPVNVIGARLRMAW
jgi:high affinity Mn2+ porin